jgi:hypothetical protein
MISVTIAVDNKWSVGLPASPLQAHLFYWPSLLSWRERRHALHFGMPKLDYDDSSWQIELITGEQKRFATNCLTSDWSGLKSRNASSSPRF